MYIDKLYNKLFSDNDEFGLNQLLFELRLFAKRFPKELIQIGESIAPNGTSNIYNHYTTGTLNTFRGKPGVHQGIFKGNLKGSSPVTDFREIVDSGVSTVNNANDSMLDQNIPGGNFAKSISGYVNNVDTNQDQQVDFHERQVGGGVDPKTNAGRWKGINFNSNIAKGLKKVAKEPEDQLGKFNMQLSDIDGYFNAMNNNNSFQGIDMNTKRGLPMVRIVSKVPTHINDPQSMDLGEYNGYLSPEYIPLAQKINPGTDYHEYVIPNDIMDTTERRVEIPQGAFDNTNSSPSYRRKIRKELLKNKDKVNPNKATLDFIYGTQRKASV